MAADKGSGAGSSASAEIEKYLNILAKDPNSRVFAPLAEAYRKAGLLDDAVETALEGLKVHPNYLGGRVALGRALYEKKQYADAAEELRKVVKAAADNIVAHKVLGQIALAQGNLPEAEKSFRMVALLDPHDQEAKKILADMGAGGLAPAAPPAVQPVPSPAEDFPLQEMSLEPPLPLEGLESHRPPADEPQPPAPALPEPLALEEFTIGPEPIDIEEPPEVPDQELPAPLPEILSPETETGDILPLEGGSGAEPIAMLEIGEPAEPAPEPMPEIEVFGREPGGFAMPPPADESPFELFGREKHGTPPPSTKGEREAYAEIEFDTLAQAPAEPEPEPEPGPDQDLVFEIFTREPRGVEAGPLKEGHGERSAFDDLEIEPTAYIPPEPGEEEPPVIELREEIPRIDVQSELELALEMERSPVEPAESVEPAAAAETLPAAEEIGWEEESPWQPVPAEEEAATPEMAPEEAATEELAWEAPAAPETAPDLASPWEETAPLSSTAEGDLEEGEPEMEAPSAEPEAALVQPAEEIVSLEEEIPGVDLAGEVVAAEAPPQPAPQQEAPVPQPAPAPQAQAGRGVFDTETLASIYINQGFYGRAAAIYERLAAGNPEDEGLRRKLEEVRALERAQAVQEGEGEELAAGEQAGRSDRAETIRRLEALLEAFRGGRPR